MTATLTLPQDSINIIVKGIEMKIMSVQYCLVIFLVVYIGLLLPLNFLNDPNFSYVVSFMPKIVASMVATFVFVLKNKRPFLKKERWLMAIGTIIIIFMDFVITFTFFDELKLPEELPTYFLALGFVGAFIFMTTVSYWIYYFLDKCFGKILLKESNSLS